MSSPYGPPGGYPQWGQQPQGPGMQPAAPGYPQPGGFAPQRPPQQPPQQPPQPPHPQQQPYGYGRPQYPQGGQYPAPGGYGRFDQFERPKKKRSALPWVLGGIGAVLAVGVVLVLGFVTPGWFVRPVFDAASVEKGVTQTLKGSYGLQGVGNVSCPSGQPVAVGQRFDCKVGIDSATKTVTVTVKNEKGVYEVGHPK
ncbi:DUF4333 domain-containing protein [Saccharopolyspora hattusasensis]|uniref:DUF4333 domain-containing protein n=1 Tax=Saccharopolyspora hattusasensis TaxID=1128679 RepID=UPI003D954527